MQEREMRRMESLVTARIDKNLKKRVACVLSKEGISNKLYAKK